MANEPSWDDIFRPADTADPVRTTVPPATAGATGAPSYQGGSPGVPASAAGAPQSRRELREAEGRTRSTVGPVTAPPP